MKGSEKSRGFALALAVFLVASASAFAKDYKTVDFDHPTSLGGVTIKPGSYKIGWVSHSPEATVTIKSGRMVVGTTEARWVERHEVYESDTVVEDTDGHGSTWVLELRFAGKTKALVFDEPHSNATLAVPVNPSTPAGVGAPTRPAQSIRFLGKPRAVGAPLPADNFQLWQEVFPEQTHALRRQMK